MDKFSHFVDGVVQKYYKERGITHYRSSIKSPLIDQFAGTSGPKGKLPFYGPSAWKEGSRTFGHCSSERRFCLPIPRMCGFVNLPPVYLRIFQGLREGARTEDIAETSRYHTNPFIVTAEKQTGSIIYNELFAVSFYVEIGLKLPDGFPQNSQAQIIHLFLGTKICLPPLTAISI